jgi:cytochrome oxidase Cu insertion factor (SCO1/SenC/PrrC family)
MGEWGMASGELWGRWPFAIRQFAIRISEHAMTLAAVRLTVLALAGFAAGAMAALAMLPQARERLLPAASVRVSGEARIGGPFVLTDQNGRRVTDADFRGRIMLVVFGSTSAPDVTAPSLQVISAALARLGPKADSVVPVLIAVDPEHDTPERLKRYIAAFHPRLVGLTGTPSQIAGVLAAYRVAGVRTRGEQASPAGYGLEAPSLIYVMGPDGRYRSHLSFAAGVDAVAKSVAHML